MPPKRARPVMVLAVDVVGDGAAKGHEACARSDRQEEAMRSGEPHDFPQGHAGLGLKRPIIAVERNEAVEADRRDEPSFGV